MFLLVIVILMAWMAANLVRSRTGGALQAFRDRDVAVEIWVFPNTALRPQSSRSGPSTPGSAESCLPDSLSNCPLTGGVPSQPSFSVRWDECRES